MHRLLVFIFLCAYATTFAFSNAANAFGQTVKVTVTHSHEHGDEHTHHHDGSGESESDGEKSSSHHGEQHSHELSMSSAIAFVASEILVSRVQLPVSGERFAPEDQRLPSKPHLLGIFRPPIA